MGRQWVHKIVLVKDNPFGLTYNNEGEKNVTSKMDFGIYKENEVDKR